LTSALCGGECSVSRRGRFTPGVKDTGTHWIGRWLGPTASMDADDIYDGDYDNFFIQKSCRSEEYVALHPKHTVIKRIIHYKKETCGKMWKGWKMM